MRSPGILSAAAAAAVAVADTHIEIVKEIERESECETVRERESITNLFFLFLLFVSVFRLESSVVELIYQRVYPSSQCSKHFWTRENTLYVQSTVHSLPVK